MIRESNLVDTIIAALQIKYGGFPFKVHGGRYQRRGMPDILWWYKGKSFAFEVKRGDDYGVTPLQQLKLERLAKEGVYVGVVKSVNEVLEIVQKALG
jgi:hypothetical protein